MRTDYPSTHHFDAVVTDRIVEEPWAVSKVRPGERVLDVGSATSRYLGELPHQCPVYAIDVRPTPPQRGIGVIRADLLRAPFREHSFDVISCISTVEHFGLDVYRQGPDEFGDEVAMRHMRRLLRAGGRLLVTAPFGRRGVYAWLRVYDKASLRRLMGGYRPLSVAYCRRDGDRYLPCRGEDLLDAGFDFLNHRSDGLVLAELTPSGPLQLVMARFGLRLRRSMRALTHQGPFWKEPTSGEPAAAWLRKRREAEQRRDEAGRD